MSGRKTPANLVSRGFLYLNEITLDHIKTAYLILSGYGFEF